MTSNSGTIDWSRMIWTTAPPHSQEEESGELIVQSAPGTDFWQRTFYGFERDNGHALLQDRSGDFTATLSFEAEYRALYDQAGLMLRVDPSSWIKFGIEFTDDKPHLSVVVTNGTSDWSARPIELEGPLAVRATRLGDAVLLQHQSDDGTWQMARLTPFASGAVGVGPYLCAPERTDEDTNFRCTFHRLSITEPAVGGLHE